MAKTRKAAAASPDDGMISVWRGGKLVRRPRRSKMTAPDDEAPARKTAARKTGGRGRSAGAEDPGSPDDAA